MYGQNSSWQDILGGLSVKRKVFVSYHHDNDQVWYNEFSRVFASTYELISDNSLDRRIDSEDPEYVERRIRENHIKGSSITIVLCGSETWKRKYIDWEICGTLYCKHALLGILLPTAIILPDNTVQTPNRLATNFHTGYAHWIRWTNNPAELKVAIEKAEAMAKDAFRINNSLPKMKRNLS